MTSGILHSTAFRVGQPSTGLLDGAVIWLSASWWSAAPMWRPQTSRCEGGVAQPWGWWVWRPAVLLPPLPAALHGHNACHIMLGGQVGGRAGLQESRPPARCMHACMRSCRTPPMSPHEDLPVRVHAAHIGRHAGQGGTASAVPAEPLQGPAVALPAAPQHWGAGSQSCIAKHPPPPCRSPYMPKGPHRTRRTCRISCILNLALTRRKVGKPHSQWC